MITGIGGAGKSTLVAKFILDQLEHNSQKKLPFVYFDFDKPGLSVSNPLELAIDALQQLSVQFPASSRIFNEIRDQFKRKFWNWNPPTNLAMLLSREVRTGRFIMKSILRSMQSRFLRWTGRYW